MLPGSTALLWNTTGRTLACPISLSVARRWPPGCSPHWRGVPVEARHRRVLLVMSRAQYRVSHLAAPEAESLFIMREVVAEFERPVLLFSGGKDSIVMLRLAEKAFAPARVPFPVMHVDTGHNFPEVLAYRDRRVSELNVQLIVASVQEAIDAGTVRETGDGMRNRIQTPVLLDAVEK